MLEKLRDSLRTYKDYLDGPPRLYRSTEELIERLRLFGVNDMNGDRATVDTIINELVL